MARESYRVFSPGTMGSLTVPNRLVRSATWDGFALSHSVTEDHLDVYKELAAGGVGTIITGGIHVLPPALIEGTSLPDTQRYDKSAIEDLERLPEAVHRAAASCRVIAQLVGARDIGPSDFRTAMWPKDVRALSQGEIRAVVACYADAARHMKEAGFDGVQLHAAQGKSCLWNFLSPYTNSRPDQYGGSSENRARIVAEIVAAVREATEDFPILAKINCVDNVVGGIDFDNFPAMAEAVANTGVDAVEVSGGTMESLLRTEKELGFPPLFAAEAHTKISNPDKQFYYLEYVERLSLDVPVILVGGVRDIERAEEVLQHEKADFISLCRPLIAEPDLPNRWREGRGSAGTVCISCNACEYPVLQGQPPPRCLYVADGKDEYRSALAYLDSWIDDWAERCARAKDKSHRH